jgi:hypothetical protein
MEQPHSPKTNPAETALNPERQEAFKQAWEELSGRILTRCAEIQGILESLPDDDPKAAKTTYVELLSEWVKDDETGAAVGFGAELNKLNDEFGLFTHDRRISGGTQRLYGSFLSGKWNTGKDLSEEMRHEYKMRALEYLAQFVRIVTEVKI